LGKSTLISNLFCKHDLYSDRTAPGIFILLVTVKILVVYFLSIFLFRLQSLVCIVMGDLSQVLCTI